MPHQILNKNHKTVMSNDDVMAFRQPFRDNRLVMFVEMKIHQSKYTAIQNQVPISSQGILAQIRIA